MRERHDASKDVISSDSDTINPPISEGPRGERLRLTRTLPRLALPTPIGMSLADAQTKRSLYEGDVVVKTTGMDRSWGSRHGGRRT